MPVYGLFVISFLMVEYLTSFQCFISYQKYFAKLPNFEKYTVKEHKL